LKGSEYLTSIQKHCLIITGEEGWCPLERSRGRPVIYKSVNKQLTVVLTPENPRTGMKMMKSCLIRK